MRTQAAWARLDRAQEVLQKCELFRDLQTRQLVEVATLAEEVMLKPNQMLLEEAQQARYIYVILEGRAVAQLETSQFFCLWVLWDRRTRLDGRRWSEPRYTRRRSRR